MVGNTICDSIRMNKKKINYQILSQFKLKKKNYFLLTLHRPDMVDNKHNLQKIITYFSNLSKRKKIKIQNFFITGLMVILIIFPHLIWLLENNFTTITYGLQRSEGNGVLTDHIIYPLLFILKQIIVLIPFYLEFFHPILI